MCSERSVSCIVCIEHLVFIQSLPDAGISLLHIEGQTSSRELLTPDTPVAYMLANQKAAQVAATPVF